jgi:hypothetical protein
MSSTSSRRCPLIADDPERRSQALDLLRCRREDTRARILHEEGNPDHRLRVEHNRETLLVHLSDEDRHGWTVLAVDRTTRRWAVSQAPRQLDAAEDAYSRLYGEP